MKTIVLIPIGIMVYVFIGTVCMAIVDKNNDIYNEYKRLKHEKGSYSRALANWMIMQIFIFAWWYIIYKYLTSKKRN